ncbi:conserved membrane hypothetical protein [Gammaproteobacteria bacterium]
MNNQPIKITVNKKFFISKLITRIMYYSRWVLAVFYSGLIVSLLLFGFYYLQKLYKIFSYIGSMENDDMILSMLSMIDMTLIASLMVMVLISGYDSFVTKFSLLEESDSMDDLTHVSSGAIKLKISTAIIVISAIYILEILLDFQKFKTEQIFWTLIMHGTLVGTGLILAIIEKASIHR